MVHENTLAHLEMYESDHKEESLLLAKRLMRLAKL